MTEWLLDTNVLAELRKPGPEPKLIRFIEARTLECLFVSTVTFAEIRFGIERVPDHARRADVHDWLTHRIKPLFDGRVLAISEDVMIKWRLLMEEGRKAGHTFRQPDLIIAATAAVHAMKVVTRDSADFARTRVVVFNPWTGDLPKVRRYQKCLMALNLSVRSRRYAAARSPEPDSCCYYVMGGLDLHAGGHIAATDGRVGPVHDNLEMNADGSAYWAAGITSWSQRFLGSP